MKMECKLAESYNRVITQQDIPVLLRKNPQSLHDLKMNIDKYISFGLRQPKLSVPQSILIAYQLISDYCVGLEISDLQLDKAYNGTDFDEVATKISLGIHHSDL